MNTRSTDIDREPRAAARQRLQSRHDFGSHLVAYVVINTMFVVIWA